MKKIIGLTFVFLLFTTSSVLADGVKTTSMKLTKEGITVEVRSAKLEKVKGDRTKENYADEKGEYFADGSKVVKAADYRTLVLQVKYTNNRKKAIHFPSPPAMAWTLKLPDGTKIKEMHRYQIGDKLQGKIEKNHTVEESIKLLIKNPPKKDGFVLTYHLLDYGKDFHKAISAAMSGKMNEKQWEKKYKKKMTPINMSIKLKME